MTRFFAAIFALSGIAGLIYESVWSHYIKLILGHAAYAQSLVLMIFMGGMALGAWGVSRLSPRIKNLLLAYVIVEFIIGILGLAFHPVFVGVNHLLFDSILPALGSGWLVTFAKIVVAAILILPQSILLGATFPLMSGGVLRRVSNSTGATVALLYFANSIGAVIGVLWSGFWLIEHFGLPGALLTAGLLNIGIAIFVYLLTKTPEAAPSAALATNVGSIDQAPVLKSWILWAAAITGAASFCYEIAWIRMLSMVLGASTHSFELMLAAFILGLALGGLWIRRRIDNIKDPQRFLGLVQIVMGVLALATLPLYNWTFELMATLMQGIARNEVGHVFFILAGHAIALLVMLPATFCAGMTLPLLTLLLWNKGEGEAAIGRVYAANTFGAICGVLLAVHVFMPLTGLKGLMLFGTLLDGALGLLLLGWIGKTRGWRWAPACLAGFAAFWLISLAFVKLDTQRMASAVYRNGKLGLIHPDEVLRWADGKTASIGLTRHTSGRIEISTNGKPDAAIEMAPGRRPTPDETTMTMVAAAPMLYRPDMKHVANVGFGSGMTTHVLLANPNIRQVDTIEIESEMPVSARLGFESRIPRAFNDPRSRLHIEDARAFFAREGRRYDMIVAEPSNPWVSGVASLFSIEYYRHVKRYLEPEKGIFVQWLQLYETDVTIVASVIAAMTPVFADFHIYAADGGNLLIVASPNKALGAPDYSAIKHPDVLAELKRVGMRGEADLRYRYLGGKQFWSAWLAETGAPVNSDFFPFVDLHAARLRFLDSSAMTLLQLNTYPVPIMETLAGVFPPGDYGPFGARTHYLPTELIQQARNIRDALLTDKFNNIDIKVHEALGILRMKSANCLDQQESQIQGLNQLAKMTVPFLTPAEMESIWRRVRETSPCLKSNPGLAVWQDFYQALGKRAYPDVARNAALLLDGASPPPKNIVEYVLVAEAVSYLANNDAAGFNKAVQKHLLPAIQQKRIHDVMVRLLVSQAKIRGWNVDQIRSGLQSAAGPKRTTPG